MIVSIISLNQKVSQSIKIDWEVRVKNEKKLIIEIFVFKVFAPSTKESVTLGKEHYQCKGGGPKCFSSVSHDNQKVSDVGLLFLKRRPSFCVNHPVYEEDSKPKISGKSLLFFRLDSWTWTPSNPPPTSKQRGHQLMVRHNFAFEWLNNSPNYTPQRLLCCGC